MSCYFKEIQTRNYRQNLKDGFIQEQLDKIPIKSILTYRKGLGTSSKDWRVHELLCFQFFKEKYELYI